MGGGPAGPGGGLFALGLLGLGGAYAFSASLYNGTLLSRVLFGFITDCC